ncbi:DUF3576 domain-containing protein [Roseovarius sp. 2305UL8-3]|uniref:DUF3576 domain-containing protein n=1 Tax=Roseovarius conchicola TaxID=3121636 RepID=UPI0035287C0C
MISSRIRNLALVAACATLAVGCADATVTPADGKATGVSSQNPVSGTRVKGGGSIFDAFRGGKAEIKVNRFLWTASLDVLNFLPVQAADPFTGVITTGYGTPPGGGRAYRATILISDPALDARSLNVALQTRNGPVAAGTQRAIEDAILNRARQLRINAGRF